MTEEEKKQAEALELVTKTAKDTATETMEAVKKENETIKEELTKAIEDGKKLHAKEIAKLQAEVKKASQITKKEAPKSGVQALGQAIKSIIEEEAETIKSFSGGNLKLSEKAISIAGSFSGASGADYENLVEEKLPLYRNPYAPVYLRNIFPNISTQKATLSIWKRDSVTGEAAIWDSQNTDGPEGTLGEKPEVTPSWSKSSVDVDWIAGHTTVPRDVLDDVDFMASEIPNVLIYSKDGVLAAENAMIVSALDSASTGYSDADLSDGLEELLGAAFQLTGNYMTPTHMLISPSDYLKYLVLNKASGSGEYDTPAGVVSFIGNQMFINNLIAVPTNGLTNNVAYVIDASQSRFVNRMNVELKMSEEHKDNFTKNMVTFRAESRAGWYTYDDNSILKVTLPST